MSDSNEEANAQRALSILTQALQEAGIRERKNLDPFPPLLGGTKVYWEQIDEDIELQLHSIRWGGGKLRTSFFLKGMALDVVRLFPEDVEAVKAMVDSLKYVQDTISGLLAHIQHDLLVRAMNIRIKQITLSADEQQTVEKIRAVLLQPTYSAFETKRKELRKKLRAEPTGKGRPQGSIKPAEKRAQEAIEFEKEIERTIRSLRSATGEMPTKTAVAKELGIGGLSLRTGIDSSLSAFNHRLKRLKVNYAAIVERLNK
jgi:hypothetical protein